MKAVRAILGIAFFVAVVYTIFLLVPPYYQHYQFQDEVASESRLGTYSQKTEDEIRENVWRKAKEFEIPITRDQINVRRDGQAVSIWVDYKVRVDLPGYPLDLQFHTASQDKKSF